MSDSYLVVKGIKRMLRSHRYNITDVTKVSVSARGPKGYRHTTIVVTVEDVILKWRIGYLSPSTYDLCDPKSLDVLDDQMRAHAVWKKGWND